MSQNNNNNGNNSRGNGNNDNKHNTVRRSGASVNASALRRMNGSWSSNEQLEKTRDKLAKSSKKMEDFQDQVTNKLSRHNNRTNNKNNVNGNGNGNGNGVKAYNGNNNNANNSGNNNNRNNNANKFVQQQQPSFNTASHVAGISQQSNTMMHDLKKQIGDLKTSMQSMTTGSVPHAGFAPHPSFANLNNGNKGLNPFLNNGNAPKATATTATTASTTNTIATPTATATPTSTALTSSSAIQGLQALQAVLAQSQDIVGSITSVGSTLQSMRTDDRFPTDFHFGLPWNITMNYDQYLEFRENYYNACWANAQAQCLWKSGADTDVGMVVATTNATTGVTTSKAIPFEISAMIFDSSNNHLIVSGTRSVPSSTNNGTVLWEPILIVFDVNVSTMAITLDTNFLTNVTESFSPIQSNWPANGMSISDIKIDTEDGSIYVLLNYLSSTKASSANPASCSLVHIMDDGTMDANFDYTVIPKYYSTDTVTGVRFVYSSIQGALYLTVHRKSVGATLLCINSTNGTTLCPDIKFDITTYLTDLCLNATETCLYIAGYDMADMLKRSCSAVIYGFDITENPCTLLPSFGDDGLSTLTRTSSGKNDPFSKYIYTRGQRIMVTTSNILLLFGNAMEDQFKDSIALQIWSVDSTTGDQISQLTWADPDFPTASYNIENLLYDAANSLVTIAGSIRFVPYQANTCEMWLAQFNLQTSAIVTYHLPCTPDLFAQSTSSCMVNNQVMFSGNMQVSKLSWGRQAIIALITDNVWATTTSS